MSEGGKPQKTKFYLIFMYMESGFFLGDCTLNKLMSGLATSGETCDKKFNKFNANVTIISSIVAACFIGFTFFCRYFMKKEQSKRVSILSLIAHFLYFIVIVHFYCAHLFKSFCLTHGDYVWTVIALVANSTIIIIGVIIEIWRYRQYVSSAQAPE
jgi:hypothetical protein